MKKLVISLAMLALAACDSNDSVNFSILEENDGTAPRPDIRVSIDRAERGFTAKWDAKGIPESWKNASLCEKTSNEENNCNLIKTEKASTGAISVKIGSDEEDIRLLQILNNQFLILFESGSGDPYAYPIDISKEKVAEIVQYFKAEDAKEGDRFASAVDISSDGSLIVIGAPFDDAGATEEEGDVLNSGAVYLFNDVAGEGWQPTDKLKFSHPSEDDNFGFHIALSDDGLVLAVAIPGDDSGVAEVHDAFTAEMDNEPQTNSGAVVLFTREDKKSPWEQGSFIKYIGPAADAQFGLQSIALSGDGKTLIASAWSNPQGGTLIASKQDGDKWFQFATIDGHKYQRSLGLNQDGTVLAVGNYKVVKKAKKNKQKEGIDLQDKTGVSLYAVTNQLKRITELKPQAGANYSGTSVSLADNGKRIAIVDSIANFAYLYENLDNEWSLAHSIAPPSSESTATNFGEKILLSPDGSHLAIYAAKSAEMPGINTKPSQSASTNGAVLVYALPAANSKKSKENAEGEAQSLTPLFSLQNAVLSKAKGFGQALGFSSDGLVLVVGAPFDDSSATEINGNESDVAEKDSGAAFVYHF